MSISKSQKILYDHSLGVEDLSWFISAGDGSSRYMRALGDNGFALSMVGR